MFESVDQLIRGFDDLVRPRMPAPSFAGDELTSDYRFSELDDPILSSAFSALSRLALNHVPVDYLPPALKMTADAVAKINNFIVRLLWDIPREAVPQESCRSASGILLAVEDSLNEFR